MACSIFYGSMLLLHCYPLWRSSRFYPPFYPPFGGGVQKKRNRKVPVPRSFLSFIEPGGPNGIGSPPAFQARIACRGIPTLLEVTLQQAFETSAVTSLVAGHFIIHFATLVTSKNYIADCLMVQLCNIEQKFRQLTDWFNFPAHSYKSTWKQNAE